MSLLNMTAVELGKKIKAGEVTVAEACKAALEQIKATEDKYIIMDCLFTQIKYIPKINSTELITSKNLYIFGEKILKSRLSLIFSLLISFFSL